jgi:hypothetical protein
MQSVSVELSKDELRILSQSLNEVCNGIDLRNEFETRMGCTRQEGRELLNKIQNLLRGIPSEGSVSI